MTPQPEPLALDLLLTEDERRPLTVAGHHEWREAVAGIDSKYDGIDLDLEQDDMIVVDPYECHAPSRRSDKDLGEFLNLLDSLEIKNDRKETTR